LLTRIGAFSADTSHLSLRLLHSVLGLPLRRHILEELEPTHVVTVKDGAVSIYALNQPSQVCDGGLESKFVRHRYSRGSGSSSKLTGNGSSSGSFLLSVNNSKL
jgi:hypothetical protein